MYPPVKLVKCGVIHIPVYMHCNHMPYLCAFTSNHTSTNLRDICYVRFLRIHAMQLPMYARVKRSRYNLHHIYSQPSRIYTQLHTKNHQRLYVCIYIYIYILCACIAMGQRTHRHTHTRARTHTHMNDLCRAHVLFFSQFHILNVFLSHFHVLHTCIHIW